MTSWTVGRNPSNDIVVDAPSVSRTHAELRRLENGRYRLTDFNSANGCFVRRLARWKRIERAEISERDRIRLGSHVATVEALLALRDTGVDSTESNAAEAPDDDAGMTSPAGSGERAKGRRLSWGRVALSPSVLAIGAGVTVSAAGARFAAAGGLILELGHERYLVLAGFVATAMLGIAILLLYLAVGRQEERRPLEAPLLLWAVVTFVELAVHAHFYSAGTPLVVRGPVALGALVDVPALHVATLLALMLATGVGELVVAARAARLSAEGSIFLRPFAWGLGAAGFCKVALLTADVVAVLEPLALLLMAGLFYEGLRQERATAPATPDPSA